MTEKELKEKKLDELVAKDLARCDIKKLGKLSHEELERVGKSRENELLDKGILILKEASDYKNK